VFATRAGEQSFEAGITQFGSLASAAQAAMKIGSLEARIKIGLGFFARVFNQVSDQIVRVEEEGDHWIWVIERCPVCWGRTADQPVCHLAIGVLRSALAWASGGKEFRMAETECKAMGDENCVIQIEKTPVN
jgi:predicted hydrocarbon binding protein